MRDRIQHLQPLHPARRVLSIPCRQPAAMQRRTVLARLVLRVKAALTPVPRVPLGASSRNRDHLPACCARRASSIHCKARTLQMHASLVLLSARPFWAAVPERPAVALQATKARNVQTERLAVRLPVHAHAASRANTSGSRGQVLVCSARSGNIPICKPL
jgi:hypothetical protein